MAFCFFFMLLKKFLVSAQSPLQNYGISQCFTFLVNLPLFYYPAVHCVLISSFSESKSCCFTGPLIMGLSIGCKCPTLTFLHSSIAENPAFGCHLEASKKKDLTMHTCVTHMSWLMMLGKSEALIGKCTCTIVNF